MVVIDLAWLVDASGVTIAGLALVALIAFGVAAWRVVAWGKSVTELLGNHLRHDLAGLRDDLADLKRVEREQTDILRQIAGLLRRRA